MDPVIKLIEQIIPLASGLLGVIIGGRIAFYNQRTERLHNRVREQLHGFYSPLYGMRARIRAKEDVLLKVTEASDAIFKKLVVPPAGVRTDVHFKYAEGRVPDFAKMTDENSRQVSEEIMPLYRKMVEHFSANMGLAEPSTLEYFGTLLEFVETWDRWARNTLPPEVAATLCQSPERLQPFYQDVETQSAQLRKRLNS